MKVLQVNRLVERENLRRESLESPSIAVLGLEVGECQTFHSTLSQGLIFGAATCGALSLISNLFTHGGDSSRNA
jgi:hypothetical protein